MTTNPALYTGDPNFVCSMFLKLLQNNVLIDQNSLVEVNTHMLFLHWSDDFKRVLLNVLTFPFSMMHDLPYYIL